MKTLKSLLSGVYEGEVPDIEIADICTDSRQVKNGDLFICLSGGNFDGHDYSLEAEMLGAAAIVCEHAVESGLFQAIVSDTRKAYSLICGNFFDNPARDMKFAAVVGTNGKTSTASVLRCILERAGHVTGQIGTTGVKMPDKVYDTGMTTPDPYELNRYLKKMRKAGVDTVICEVTAHAIFWKKTYGIKADYAIFTNVSKDHLDFFGDMETYAGVKRGYFSPDNVKVAVVNSDDENGRAIISAARTAVFSYGINQPADVFAIDIRHSDRGLEFVINLFDDVFGIAVPLYGRHNVYNVLAAATLAKLMGVDGAVIKEALENADEIEGRFNIFYYNGAKIIVDFAHTPDGLDNLLQAAAEITDGKIVTVFGCGGNRDRTKRAEMGTVAGMRSDEVVITSDNPRYEQPMDIISDILPGVKRCGAEYIIIQNRKEAIAYAISRAGRGDTVVIAGKGGEKYTEVKGKKIAYSDENSVKAFIEGGRID
ncbi:MAG TPA: UDP-N-acetylmuramoyl-L-alanyl-D-glutamate--2,6-diaminopimelate ligase [Candidatus Faecicola pullistercoris]|nr:UDP-N-acetylmuramoyl-L-alanyl-D-glutamate--2,6-diaminopimelate ligase [Candidatus Faecicola pullistercoris]